MGPTWQSKMFADMPHNPNNTIRAYHGHMRGYFITFPAIENQPVVGAGDGVADYFGRYK